MQIRGCKLQRSHRRSDGVNEDQGDTGIATVYGAACV